MTIDLYRRNSAAPAPLPAVAYTAKGLSRTDLANQPDSRKELGFVFFAAIDPATQQAVERDGQWVVETTPFPVAPGEDARTHFVPVAMVRQRAEKLGIWDELAAYISQYPTLLLKVLTLDSGLVDPGYPDLLDGLEALNVPASYRTYLLAPPSAGVPDVPNA